MLSLSSIEHQYRNNYLRLKRIGIYLESRRDPFKARGFTDKILQYALDTGFCCWLVYHEKHIQKREQIP